MAIGARIEERRKAVGIKTQTELARRAGVGQSTLNGIINREYRWSPHLTRIARELSTTVEYLVGDSDNPDENAPPPPSPPRHQLVTMQVALPSERALARMFEGLLAAMDRTQPVDEQARLLAQRLPIGLSQLRDVLPDRPTASPEPREEAAEALATHQAQPR